MQDWSKIKRKKELMPAFVKNGLIRSNTMELYKMRPSYQQNDYLSWIKRAKQEETKQRRLEQMIVELKEGNVYMNMKWTSCSKKIKK